MKTVRMNCPNCGKVLTPRTKLSSGRFKCMNQDCIVVRITIDYRHISKLLKEEE